MRALLVATLALVGGACRGGFDLVAADAPPPPVDVPLDAPPTAHVCGTASTTIPPLGGSGTLAVTRIDPELVAVWTDGAGALHGARIGGPAPLAPRKLANGPFGGVTGVNPLGSGTLAIVTTAGAEYTLWTIDDDLAPASLVPRHSAAWLVGREPFANVFAASLSDKHAFVRASGNQLSYAYIGADGPIGPELIHTTPAAIVELAVTDGVDHAHLVWRDSNGDCKGDYFFFGPGQPMPIDMSSTSTFANDCHELRVAYGPEAVSDIIVAWRGTDRVIHAIFDRPNLPALTPTLSQRGRQPRLIWDGDADAAHAGMWAAWLDENPGTTGLMIGRAQFEGEGAGEVLRELQDPTPAGDQAFELVRVGEITYLVVLQAEKLVRLELCR